MAMRRFAHAAALFAFVAIFARLGGCAGGSKPGAGPNATTASTSSKSNEHSRSLSSLAAAEKSGRPIPRDVPLPPGIEPAALMPHSSADEPESVKEKSKQTLAQVLDASLLRPLPAPPVSEPAAPVTPDQQSLALKAYAKGRNAALDNRHLQAVTEYQKALAIDPNSPQVLREAARSYDALGNQQRAVELLERLVQVDPNDAQALFALGVAAATRRDFDAALQYLARFHRDAQAGGHDLGADIIADYTLATALRELGCDRAFIELASSVAAMPAELAASAPGSRLASVYRQRGDLWRGIGDAYARTGDLSAALEAWTTAASLPSADPSALQPRVIYANLRMGRPYGAQLALLESIQLSVAGGAVNDRDVRLCAYVAEHAKPTDRLAQELLELQQANPEDGGAVRATAMLLPADRAMALLRAFVEQRPQDTQTLTQLMTWLQRDDIRAAAALTVALAEAQPANADAHADAFSRATPGFTSAARALRALPSSPAQAVVLSRVLSNSGALGDAWTTCEQALQRWPSDRSLRLRMVQLAAEMQEPALVNRTIAACADITDVPGLLALASARRAMNQPTQALALAQQAAVIEPDNVDVQVALAKAHRDLAASMVGETSTSAAARLEIDAAVAASNRAIELDPQRDACYEALALIYGPGGVLADSQLFRDTLVRLRQGNPQSPLYNRLVAQDALQQRRFDQALERLINAYDGDPSDGSALTLAVAAWQGKGDIAAAEAWIRERLQQRPGDAILRGQLLRVQMLQRHADQAVAELEKQVQADPDDWTARRLLENAYMVTGQNDARLELGERRLLAQPKGVRREIELADLYAGAERADTALEHLEMVRDLVADASMADMIAALVIAQRIKGDQARQQAVALDLAHLAIERHPEAPLDVYGFALRALAGSDADDQRFDELVREAVAKSKGANDTGFRGARLWQELAQGLVADGLTDAAARVLRVRLASEPTFEDGPFGALARITLVLDAEAAYQSGPENAEAAAAHVERSIALLRDLQQRKLLERTFDLTQPITLAQAMYETSSLYTLVGAQAGSESIMRQLLALHADDAMTLNNLGYMLLEQGGTDPEIVRMIEHAYELEPEEFNILDTVGWLRYKQGRLSDDATSPGAVTLIQKAVDGSPDPSAEVFDHLGDAKWRLGDEEGAIAAWKRVVGMLEAGTFRERLQQNISLLQTRQWGIVVMDVDRMYDREYAPVLQRAQQKIDSATRGEQPNVAPQWAK